MQLAAVVIAVAVIALMSRRQVPLVQPTPVVVVPAASRTPMVAIPTPSPTLAELSEMPPVSEESLRLGAELYRMNCSPCHGPELHGWAEGGTPAKLLDMTDLNAYRYGPDLESMFRNIAFGIDDTGMAAWGDILEPNEIWALCQFIRSKQSLVE